MGTNWKELTDSAKSRSDIYGLLATVFREEPTVAFIKELRGLCLSETFSDLGVVLGNKFYNDPVSEVVEALGLEFTRLFIGPGPHISAHESVFIQLDGNQGMGSLWGATTVEVKNFIESAGLKYKPKFTGMPDHISVELEFMQKAAIWEAELWDMKDKKSAQKSLKIQHLFLEQHLLNWFVMFCDTVVKQAKIPFYKEMSKLAQNYIEFECQNMGIDKKELW